MPKTIAYLRVSTKAQVKSGLGLEAQLKAASQKIGRKPDIIFRDDGISGKRMDRKGFQDALESLEPGDTLIITEISRLGRSVGKIIVKIDELIQSGVRIISIKENLDIKQNGDIQTKILLTMLSLFSDIERELTSQRTIEALAIKRSRGEKLGGRVPLGFRVEKKNGKKVLVEDPEQQEHIRKIIQLDTEGFSIREICKKMESITGKKWYPGTVHNVVRSV